MRLVLIQAVMPHLTMTEIEWLYNNDDEFRTKADELYENVMREIDA